MEVVSVKWMSPNTPMCPMCLAYRLWNRCCFFGSSLVLRSLRKLVELYKYGPDVSLGPPFHRSSQ